MRDIISLLETDKEKLQAELERIGTEMDLVWEDYMRLNAEKVRLQKEIEWRQDPANTVEGGLLANTKEWLITCADYVHLTLLTDRKEEIAHALAEHLLEPVGMVPAIQKQDGDVVVLLTDARGERSTVPDWIEASVRDRR